MLTIKDIARRAGVSHGTVSNVLNKKNNVSAEKIAIVESIAKELKYSINTQASQLRAKCSNKIILILPNISQSRYRDFYKGVELALKDKNYELIVYITNYKYRKELEMLKIAQASIPIAIILVPSKSNQILDIYNEEKIHLFENNVNNKVCFMFDFYQAGVDMGKRCLLDENKKVAIYCQNIHNAMGKAFLKGIDDVFKNIKYTLFKGNEGYEIHTAFDITTYEDKFDAIITTNIEVANYIREVANFNCNTKKMDIYSIESKNILSNKKVITYELDYQQAGYSVVNKIIKEKKIDKHFIFENYGFKNKVGKIENNANHTIKILTLTSPTVDIIKKLLSNFTNKTEINVEITDLTYEEIYEILKDEKKYAMYDIIRIDIVWLTEFAEKVFLDLEFIKKSNIQFLESISPIIPDDYYYVNDKKYSVPFDTSVQIMFYRKDLFSDTLIRRKFYEQYKSQLKAPKTYEQYLKIAKFFTREYNKSSPTIYGATQVCGQPMTAASDYLPRLFEKKWIDSKGEICINKDIFEKTLNEYLEMRKYCNNNTNMWWKDAIDEFASGDTATCIVYSNHVATVMKFFDENKVSKIGFCKIPSSKQMLGGGVLGICKNSNNILSSLKFLEWLYSDEISRLSTYLGGFIANKNIFTDIRILELYPWIKIMEPIFTNGTRRKIEKRYLNFNEFEFEFTIGEIICNIVQNKLSIKDAHILVDNYISKIIIK